VLPSPAPPCCCSAPPPRPPPAVPPRRRCRWSSGAGACRRRCWRCGEGGLWRGIGGVVLALGAFGPRPSPGRGYRVVGALIGRGARRGGRGLGAGPGAWGRACGAAARAALLRTLLAVLRGGQRSCAPCLSEGKGGEVTRHADQMPPCQKGQAGVKRGTQTGGVPVGKAPRGARARRRDGRSLGAAGRCWRSTGCEGRTGGIALSSAAGAPLSGAPGMKWWVWVWARRQAGKRAGARADLGARNEGG
jgi:hypothetical protein